MRRILNCVTAVAALCCIVWTSPGGQAQTTLFSFTGDTAGDAFGGCVRSAGDVNADGFDDVIAGSALDDNAGFATGSVQVFSGVDGSVLYLFTGGQPWTLYGGAVNGAGDLNADGHDDFLIGAPQHNGIGAVFVHSGLDGGLLYTLTGPHVDSYFGQDMESLGDVDGDSVPDFAVAAPWDNGETLGFYGCIRIFSGVDGALLRQLYGETNFTFLGYSLSSAGDIDGDGITDLIAGGDRADHDGYLEAGTAQVFSGSDGSVLYTFYGQQDYEWFGSSVSGAGDVNSDGYADVIIGAIGNSKFEEEAGCARVYSGRNGHLLRTYYGDAYWDWLGTAVCGVGDVDGDGFDDVAVGSPYANGTGVESGRVFVYSGKNGQILYTIDGQDPGDVFGSFVEANGDVNADGNLELFIGDRQDGDLGPNTGSAWVISWTPSAWIDLGEGLTGTNGVPSLAGSGPLQEGKPTALALTNALESSTTALVLGLSEINAPFMGGVLVPAVDVLVLGLPVDASGRLQLTASWPAGVPPGLTMSLQHWVTDPSGAAGFAASNAVGVTTP
jgi:hypothetical protein